MTERTAKSLDEMSMAELWSVAKLLGVSKDGKRDELVARIKQAQDQEGGTKLHLQAGNKVKKILLLASDRVKRNSYFYF